MKRGPAPFSRATPRFELTPRWGPIWSTQFIRGERMLWKKH